MIASQGKRGNEGCRFLAQGGQLLFLTELEIEAEINGKPIVLVKEQSIDGCNGGFVTGDQTCHVLTEVLDLLLGSKHRGKVHQVVNDNARELNDWQAHGHALSARF